jgi:origin recognition complex subunit 4
MESHRSTKRRKLDVSEETIPRATQDAGRTSLTRKNGTSTANGVSSQPAAHDAWKEAKARTQALRGKRPSQAHKEKDIGVYDDIEGAHAQRPGFQQNPPPASTPSKQRLDPLRNQKSSPAVTSSPSKRPTLDFFKQFHSPKPKVDTTPSQSQDVRDVSVKPAAEQHGRKSSRTTTPAATVNGAVHSRESPTHLSSAKPGWKGWAYAQEPKKTFEDEIKELANAAREQAKHGDEDSTQRLSERRRTAARPAIKDEKPLVPTDHNADPSSTMKRSENRPTARKKHARSRDEPQPRSALSVSDARSDIAVDEPSLPVSAEARTQQQHTVETVIKETKAMKILPRPSQSLKGLSFDSEHLQIIQTIVLEKLTAKRPIPLVGMETEYSKVSNLVAQTITAGESNSMLVIGARGSGKSVVVDQILREQTNEHPNDFHIVRLNGFIYTDDKLALREIWRQLGREMDAGEDDSAPKNYADTLTTLLALLSHPAEQGREQEQDQITKSVIFVIDEFDLFATHPRQTLLYNLFDIAQSRKAPIAVLGLTTRIDVAESLEKRVKSRFSHRYVYLGMPRSFVAFEEVCKSALTMREEDLKEEERGILGAAPNAIQTKLNKASKDRRQSPIASWNALIDAVMAHETTAGHLRRLYVTSKSIPAFHASMLLPVSSMATRESVSGEDLLDHFTNSFAMPSLLPPDSKLLILASLSTLHLAILICAARLTAIHNVDAVPFAQAYEEYKLLASKAKLQASASGTLAQGAGSRASSKDVAKDAWEDLVGTGLILADGGRGCRIDIALEEIGMSGVDLGSWGRWCKQI